MLQSHLTFGTRKEAPRDEVAKNASLLVRAGYINKLHAGVYTFLPLGLRTFKKIEQIIREKVNAVGAQEVFMPSLQPKENWEKTGRWDTMTDLFKVKDASDREYALGPTHEEVVVPLVQQFATSYKQLPLSVYQFQTKFRMELRAKSGILRVREFTMKDMYSYHTSEEDLSNFYERMKLVYADIFDTVGIGHVTKMTFASGGSFSKYSHEFQAITPAGEDTIYVCQKCNVAVNKEIIADQSTCPECGNDKLVEEKAIEVGNIFDLKTKFSKAFDYTVKDGNGVQIPVLMGCYGIGVGRLLGTVVEVLADEKGLVWPANIAPFDAHIIVLGKDETLVRRAKELEVHLGQHHKEVLIDDRDVSAGEKFADADLIGIPVRIVISEKTENQGVYEVKNRSTGTVEMIPAEKIASVW